MLNTNEDEKKTMDGRDDNDNNGAAATKHVILFGISGDPPTGTGGHVGIAQQLVDHVRGLQKQQSQQQQQQQVVSYEIRILPVYRHTFAEKQQRLISYDDRLEMCRLAFENLNQQQQQQTQDPPHCAVVPIVVSNAEQESWRRANNNNSDDPSSSQLPPVAVGTAALMEYLLQTEGVDTQFSFCLGADSFLSLMEGKWNESPRVLELLRGQFIVVNRIYANDNENRGDNYEQQQQQQHNERQALRERVEAVPGAKLLPPNPTLGAVSSSQVRSWLQRGVVEDELRGRPDRISPSVLSYIQRRGLYGLPQK
mmetsp:Transcript_14743/g.40731  ORF Transcript_14743/g.40731 Transcript_14743/m.40731 type:complete len:310 (+) Transcript_14743:119-1048(+)